MSSTPARVALIVTLVGMVSSAAGGAVFLALASVATRRRWRELAWLVPLNVVSGLAIEEFYPSADAATPHQSVITVMEAARRSGLSQITFATQSSAQAGAR